MKNGWISLHRKIMDDPIYSNANMLKLWVHCLLKASHAKHQQLVGNQLVQLEVGEFVTGRESLFYEFNRGVKPSEQTSSSTLWRWLKNFEQWQMLNIKTTTKYSIVSVLNWSQYQDGEQQSDNGRTSNEQQVSTNNNVNNANKDNKKDTPRKQVYDTDSPAFILASYFYKQILQNNPGHKEPNFQKWADDIRKLLELDKRDKKEVGELMRWVQKDDFEMANVLSPAKLRTRYDNLVMKMRQVGKTGQVAHTPTAPAQEFEFDPTKGE